MVEKALKVTKYINQTTGEFYDKRQYVDMQFNEDGYLFWNRKSNVKTFIEYPLPDIFTWAEKGRIDELKHYILKDNQFLVYRSGNTIKPISIKEMMKIFEMSDRQCRTLIKKMKKTNIIKEIKFNEMAYFAFNPLYGFKEKRLSLNVYLFFQEELREVLPQWVVDKFASQANELQPNFYIIK